jgi:hypothetical protein
VISVASPQNPTATHVAGFHTWHKLGRFVKKGEKGILILAPIVRPKSHLWPAGIEVKVSAAISVGLSAFADPSNFCAEYLYLLSDCLLCIQVLRHLLSLALACRASRRAAPTITSSHVNGIRFVRATTT